MPELPDVEGYRCALAGSLPRREIRGVRVLDAGILHGTSPAALGRRLHGHVFAAPRRHGKWLVLPTDGPVLLVHNGMTGHPYYRREGDNAGRFDRLVLSLDRGEFRYADQRKLRGVWVAADETDVGRIIGPIGPDAAAIDLADFRERLGAARRPLKSALMDQKVLARLGNLLVDEICWQARINPLRPAATLSADATERLHRTMRRVLRTSVRHARVPALRGWLTRVRDDPDPRCPRCRASLRLSRVQGRATRWCAAEQPELAG
jgi:formamidopyrimidine-DNA glycosylase